MKKISGAVPDALVILIITLAVGLFFSQSLLNGTIFYESDTSLFYYPVLAEIADALRQGTLPLWSPYIFGGYPLFADGEGGVLHPVNLILLTFFPLEQALVWLVVIRFFLAAIFMYGYGRVIRLEPMAALVPSLVFAFGGFSIAQLHHMNISQSSLWLPLLLLFIELGLRNKGLKRYVYLALGGLSFGIQSLWNHPQILAMTGMMIVAYAVFRGILMPHVPRARESVDRGISVLQGLLSTVKAGVPRVGWGLLAAGLILAIGVGVGAVQLLPLYELGQFSMRVERGSYLSNMQYPLSPYNLITLVFPYFFRNAQGEHWGLWSAWESAVYVGIMPILLALIGVFCARTRRAIFFAFVAVSSLLVAFANYFPLNIHYLLYRFLPGFSYFRAPARFSYFVLFAIAVLSGIGFHWLQTNLARSRKDPSTERERGARVLARFLPLTLILSVLLPLILPTVSWWLRGNTELALRILQRFYISTWRLGKTMTAGESFSNLLNALSLDNPNVRISLLLLFASVLLLLGWNKFRRSAFLWGGLSVVLIILDLFLYGWKFHPTTSVKEVMSQPPAARFLEANNGLYRFYVYDSTDLDLNAPWIYSRPDRLASYTSGTTGLESNRLLPLKLSDSEGYSSLRPQRHAEYGAVVRTTDNNQLLNLWNVRYVVESKKCVPFPSFAKGRREQVYVPPQYLDSKRCAPPPSFEGTSFDPSHALLSTYGQGPSNRTAFRIPSVKVTEVRIISTLRYATDVPQDTPVAEMELTDSFGNRQTLTLRVGIDTGEGAYDRPDVLAQVKHSRPRIAFSWQEDGPGKQRFRRNLYYSRLSLKTPSDQPLTITRLELRSVYPKATIEVFGISLANQEIGTATPIRYLMRERYKSVYEDQGMVIYENSKALPRAFLVPSATISPPGYKLLEQIAQGEFEPEKNVVLDKSPETVALNEAFFTTTGVSLPPGMVQIEEYRRDKVVVSVVASSNAFLFLGDTYYPGWRVLVDGRESQLYRANYLFRAVYVPAGYHQVVFFFDSPSFRLGKAISLTTLALLALGGGWGLAWRFRKRV